MLTINKKSPSVKQNLAQNFNSSPELRRVLYRLPQSAAKVLHKLWVWKKHYQLIYASQSKIAEATGLCRQTVNEAVKMLHENGLIDKEYRHAKTCIYHIPGQLREDKNALTIAQFFRQFFYFALFLLSSSRDVSGKATQYLENEKKLPKSINEEAFKTYFFIKSHRSLPADGYYFSENQWPYQQSYDGDRNKSVSFEEFSAWLADDVRMPEKKEPKRRGVMYNFSQEELEKLAQYPTEAVKLANKSYGQALLRGKTISNPFGYYVAVCDAFVAESQSQKTPQTGKAMVNRPKIGPLALWKSPQRTVVEESDYDFCLKVETALHKAAHIDKNPFAKTAAQFPNMRWALLTPAQQAEIMKAVHQECRCRTNIIPSLQNPGMLEAKANHWNDKILKVDAAPTPQAIPAEMMG